jgi:hypothetical protein
MPSGPLEAAGAAAAAPGAWAWGSAPLGGGAAVSRRVHRAQEVVGAHASSEKRLGTHLSIEYLLILDLCVDIAGAGRGCKQQQGSSDAQAQCQLAPRGRSAPYCRMSGRKGHLKC